MLAYFKKYYPVITLAIFSFIFMQRLFIKDYLIYGEEQGFINYDFVNYRHTTLWDFSHNFGSISSSFFNLFTTGLYWKIAHLGGLSPLTTERLFLFLMIFLTTFFSYSFFQLITKKPLISVLLAIAFMTSYNYYTIITTTPKIFHYLILSSSLFFWEAYIIKNQRRYLIINFTLLILLLSIGINPPQMIGAYSLIFFYLFFFYVKKQYIKRILIFLVPYILNIILVFFTNYLVIKYGSSLKETNPFQVAFSATASPVHEIFRFFGAWWDYAGSENLQYNHLSNYYHSLWGVIFTYLPVFLFLTLLTVQDTSKAIKLKLISIIVITLLLVKGNTTPLSGIFNTLFTINIFKIFREPWAKFIPNFIVLIYLGIAYLSAGKKNIFKITFILCVIIVFQIIPLLQGRIIDHRNLKWKVSDAIVPSYWLDIKNWSQSHAKDKRILILPVALDQEQINHSWYPYQFRGRPEEYFVYSNIITDTKYSIDDTFIIPKYFNSLNSSLISASNIDYVLDKKDIRTTSKDLLTINSIRNVLDASNVISFDKVDIYPVKKELLRDKVRTVTSLSGNHQPCDLLTSNADRPVVKDNLVDSLSDEKIHYNYLSPTTYKVDFLNSPDKNTALIFGDTYNKGWKLYTSDSFFSRPLPLETMSANCFNNMWIIPQDVISSHRTLYIQYEPQLLFDQFLMFYIVSSLIYIFILFIISPQIIASSVFSIKWKDIDMSFLNRFRSSFILMLRPFIFVFLFSIIVIHLLGLKTSYTIEVSNIFQTAYICIAALVFFSYRLSYKFSLLLTLLLLILTIHSRITMDILFAEKYAHWIVLFLFIAAVQLALEQLKPNEGYTMTRLYREIIDDLEIFRLLEKIPFIGVIFLPVTKTKKHIQNSFDELYRNLIKILKRIYGSKPIEKKGYITLAVKIIITFLVVIFLYFVNYQLQRIRTRASLTPKISEIEPNLVYKSNKVIIRGTGFGWNKGEKIHLLTQNEEVITELWTDTKIIFTIPLSWKAGPKTLWIQKPINWDGQEIYTSSNAVTLKVITAGNSLTPDDDAYFEQLKHLSKEALEINGYK